MKVLKNKFILSIILLTILSIVPQVYAKTSIEIKPNSDTVYTNKTISQFFDEAMAMKNVGEGLEDSNVDVHMATNTDWAIVSYFSNSAYGTNGEGNDTGVNVTMGGKTYKSTNGNVTGVMNFGSTLTWTAGVSSKYKSIVNTTKTEEVYDWGESIIEHATNSKYVDLLHTVSAKDMALRSGYIYDNIALPFSVRKDIFTLYGSGKLSAGYPDTDGQAKKNITFRPAFWN